MSDLALLATVISLLDAIAEPFQIIDGYLLTLRPTSQGAHLVMNRPCRELLTDRARREN